MSEYDEILSQIPMDQVAERLGVDRAEAEQATRTALPALLGGLQANASDPSGAASLAGALQQHGPGLLGSPLEQVDTDDGQKIVQNIFGGNTSDVVSALGVTSGGKGSGLIQQLLPILAPIVMSYLAAKLGGAGGLGSVLGGAAPSSGGATPTGDTDVFGTGVVPDPPSGATPAAPTSDASAAGGITDILGQILGAAGGAGGATSGAGASGSAGGTGAGGLDDLLGGVLGGLLGGGKR